MNSIQMNGAGGGGIVFIVVGIIALVIVAVIFGSIQARKRREALAAWAAMKGLNFSEGRDSGFRYRFPDLAILRAGEGGQYAYNIIAGPYLGRGLTAFDYHYETYSTDKDGHRKTSHHHFSALIVAAGVPLKPLHIRPEGIFDKMAAAFGFDDIDFESAEFSRRFKVSAPERKWAYDILHTRAIEFLLALPKFSMQFDNANVIYWTSGCWTPEQFEQGAGTVNAFLELIPDYVKQQQTGH